MAYYVSNTGDLFTFSVGPNNTIRLSNGATLQDPPPGEMFATEVSAKKYSELVIEQGVAEGKKRHREWVQGDRDY